MSLPGSSLGPGCARVAGGAGGAGMGAADDGAEGADDAAADAGPGANGATGEAAAPPHAGTRRRTRRAYAGDRELLPMSRCYGDAGPDLPAGAACGVGVRAARRARAR